MNEEEANNLTYFAFAKPLNGKPLNGKPHKAEPALAPTKASVGVLPDVLAGRYRIERLLGAGGMGAVYRARDLLSEQFGDPDPYIALKILSEEFAESPDASALLYSEFALTRRLRHDNVLRLHTFEVDTDCQRAFIEGYSYSTLELPLIKDGDQLSLRFFRGDLPDPELQDCRDGRDLEAGVDVECAYKDAASIKKRLADLDAKIIADSKVGHGINQDPRNMSNSASVTCPSTEFPAFLAAFSERADVQKAFVQQPLQLVTTVAGDPEPELQKSSVSGEQIKFPIIPDRVKREADGLTLTVKEERGNNATAILQKPDTDYVFEYQFVRGQCWQLAEVWDFSL